MSKRWGEGIGRKARARAREKERGKSRKRGERWGVLDFLLLVLPVPGLEALRTRQIAKLTQMDPDPVSLEIVTPRKPPPAPFVRTGKRLRPILIVRRQMGLEVEGSGEPASADGADVPLGRVERVEGLVVREVGGGGVDWVGCSACVGGSGGRGRSGRSGRGERTDRLRSIDGVARGQGVERERRNVGRAVFVRRRRFGQGEEGRGRFGAAGEEVRPGRPGIVVDKDRRGRRRGGQVVSARRVKKRFSLIAEVEKPRRGRSRRRKGRRNALGVRSGRSTDRGRSAGGERPPEGNSGRKAKEVLEAHPVSLLLLGGESEFERVDGRTSSGGGGVDGRLGS